MVERVIKLEGRGLRGDSYADVARRSGLFGILPSDDDETVIGKINADAAASADRAEMAVEQAADLVLPENRFVAADLATARSDGEAGTSAGTYFIAVGEAEGEAEVRLRTAGGSDLIYTEVTKTALASTAAGKGADLLSFIQDDPSAAVRTALRKMRERFSVFDIIPAAEHDAIKAGTSTYDCTAAVQIASDAAGTLYWPAGTYKISSAITRKQNSVWVGDGPESTIIHFSGTDGDLMQVGTSDYVRTENMQFLSLAGKASTTDEVAVRLGPDGGSVFTTFYNCIFDGWSVSGIYQTRGWNVAVENCYFIRCGNKGVSGDYTGGIVYDRTGSGQPDWSGSGAYIRGTTFIGCEYGIYNDAMWNLTVDNTIFEDTGTSFYKSANGAMMTIRGCWFEDCDNQAKIEGSVYIVGGRQPLTTGQNPSSGVNFDGIAGPFGRVIYQDGDGIARYSNSTGVPPSSIDFVNRVVYTDKVQSRAGDVQLQSSTGQAVGIDNTNGDFRPFGTDAVQDLGGPSNRWRDLYADRHYVGAGTRFIDAGSGSPEGVVIAPVGSIWMRTDGSAGTCLYVKESGSGNTGWVAK